MKQSYRNVSVGIDFEVFWLQYGSLDSKHTFVMYLMLFGTLSCSFGLLDWLYDKRLYIFFSCCMLLNFTSNFSFKEFQISKLKHAKHCISRDFHLKKNHSALMYTKPGKGSVNNVVKPILLPCPVSLVQGVAARVVQEPVIPALHALYLVYAKEFPNGEEASSS